MFDARPYDPVVPVSESREAAEHVHETDGHDDSRYPLCNQRYGNHHVLAEWIRPGSRILDVGCGRGHFMLLLQDEKGCDTTGVELDDTASRQARLAGLRVLQGDSAEQIARAAESEAFDHIVFADVLEHMVDPAAALAACRSALKPDGTVLVSLPNIVSLRARVRIARGVWRYEDTGIFDRTHLRFFSIATGAELLEEAGFAIGRRSFVGPLSHRGGRRGAQLTALWPGLLASQMIFEAKPTEAARDRTSPSRADAGPE